MKIEDIEYPIPIPLTREEIESVRKAARHIESGIFVFSCIALKYRTGPAGHDAAKKYAEFYGFRPEPIPWSGWENLPDHNSLCTPQTQLQRELMLELFAHLGGNLEK